MIWVKISLLCEKESGKKICFRKTLLCSQIYNGKNKIGIRFGTGLELN